MNLRDEIKLKEKNYLTHLALHQITVDKLREEHLNLHILRIQKLYENELRLALFCFAQGNALQKAQTYSNVLRQKEISSQVPRHIKQAIVELAIARYQLNLLDDGDITTILPPPPETITQPENYKFLEDWAVGLQDKIIQLLSGNKILTLFTDVVKTHRQLTIQEEFKPAINQKKNVSHDDLKEKIKQTICSPQAITFWRQQVWRGDEIKLPDNSTSRAPTGVKNILDCLNSQASLDTIQEHIEQALSRTSIFCCGKPLGRTTETHSYYLLIHGLKYDSPDEIEKSIKKLDMWMNKNKIIDCNSKMREPTTVSCKLAF